MVELRLPEGASVNRTAQVQAEVDTMLRAIPGVDSVASVTGFSILDGVAKSNAAFALVSMQEFAQRPTRELSAFAAIMRTMQGGQAIREGQVIAFNLPPIRGLAAARGSSSCCLTRRGGAQSTWPRPRADGLCGQQNPELATVYTTFSAESPQLYLSIDRERLYTLQVP